MTAQATQSTIWEEIPKRIQQTNLEQSSSQKSGLSPSEYEVCYNFWAGGDFVKNDEPQVIKTSVHISKW